MQAFSVIKDFRTRVNQDFLDKAALLETEIKRRRVYPKCIIEVGEDEQQDTVIMSRTDVFRLREMRLSKHGKVILDFGDHEVGYVSFDVVPIGSHYDAPAFLRLKFAEVLSELTDDSADYDGWISSSWLQEEYIHVDVLPVRLELPRRYAFRYLEIEVLDTSPKYSLSFDNACCEYVSAADMESIRPLGSDDELLNRMDHVSIKTLADCMQSVFEDGVKRDRRLWLGDLRLQALVNYQTFKNYDMVKRCLYMFAGMTFDDGRIGACFFHEPEMMVDDTYLMDYALLFASTLWDYYEASGDEKTLRELYPQAIEQIEICLKGLENHVVKDRGDEFWCFLDWGDGLNKQAGTQAVLIYSMRHCMRMAEAVNDTAMKKYLENEIGILCDAAKKFFWDEELGLFVSGPERQISWASQIWMILAQVFDEEKSHKILMTTIKDNPQIKIVTPYMYHYYIEALIFCGEKTLALNEMEHYWGEMINDGADTFWEIYNPDNKNESPYGSSMVNSYCHAWSCTPAYFLRKYFI